MANKKSSPRTAPQTLGMPRCGVDSHAHLDDERFTDDLEAVLERARQSGVAQIGNVFLSMDAYRQSAERFAAHPEIFFLLGIHPCDGMSCTPETLEAMEAAFRQDVRLRAVGEIGLDYYWNDCPKTVQRQIFQAQLALARRLDKPVVIHCRDAQNQTVALHETLDTLEGEGFRDRPLLWHCFTADAQAAQRIISNGWYLSVPGPVTYPANTALREALRSLPGDRLLVETDAPYLAPREWRGQRNEPAFTVFTARCLAKERGEDPALLWRRCGDNARRFFGISPCAEVSAATPQRVAHT